MICISGGWVGVDSVWEQEKLEATLCEMLENGGDQAREQSTVTTLVPGEQRMESPIPAQERWGSHLPKRSEGVDAVLARNKFLWTWYRNNYVTFLKRVTRNALLRCLCKI
jgi:hypothetical protein